MSFMPLSGCTFLAQRLSTAIDHLHLHNFACQSILPRLHCQTLSWVDSLEHRHLYISTCQQVLAHLHCQDRNRRYSLDNFYPSNMKPWTEDIRLTTFTCTTSLAKQHVHSSSANLELHTTTWSHALAQLHLPTNARTPPMGNLELKTFTWQDSLDNFRPVRKPTFLECGIQQLTLPGNHTWRMYTCKPFLDTPHFDSFTERHAGSQRKTSNNLKLL